MHGHILARQPANAVFRAAAAAISILVLTSVHHAYGAVVYDTPWRMHILFFAVPAALAIAGLFWLGLRRPQDLVGSVAAWAGLALAVGFPILMIGFYEGGYNHFVKIVLYYTAPTELVARLFPTPPYLMPNDIVFEATGVMQFALALVAANRIRCLFKREDEAGVAGAARG